MIVEFIVPGQPVAKGRPRARIVTPKDKPSFVSMYTPSETVAYEARVAQIAKRAMGSVFPSAAPVEVRMELRMQIPPSWSKKKQAAALAGTVRATNKPDCDNVAKGIFDACNGIVFDDDNQVVALSVRKFYALDPCVVVAIRDVEGEPA